MTIREQRVPDVPSIGTPPWKVNPDAYPIQAPQQADLGCTVKKLPADVQPSEAEQGRAKRSPYGTAGPGLIQRLTAFSR